jgi:hypothetical protein
MCKAQVCTPNQAVCNGTIATTCAADGSGYAKGHDCLGSGELCYDGTCHYGPMSSWTFCSGSQVVRCYTDGDCESHATCTSAQYCDSATATCKSLLCTPNQPTCNSNNTPTVCSADGMSYVNDGAPCGSQRCVSGTCQDALFAEDFEDGDLAGWQVSNGAGWSITTTHAAAGTLHGLWGENGSIYQTFAGLKPNRISWWVMAPLDTVESGHFALTSTSGQDRLIATSYFKNDGTLVLVLDTEPVVIPYAANIWYHIELRNFNWTAKTFDYYVNDTLIRAAFPFQATDATSIGRLDLSNPGVVTAYWDQIAFD